MQTENSITTVTAYDVLGIAPDAAQRDVHAALRKLALAWHPDRVPNWRRGEATLRFQSIMDAYNKIRTPDGRQQYDDTLASTTLRAYRPNARPNTATRKTGVSNDNIPFAAKAKAWFRALETVFWPMRK